MTVGRIDRTKKISNHFNRQAGAYSLAAAVAGVSILALAQPAAGEVVVTKKTIPLLFRVDIDINHDGIADFHFYNSYSFGSAFLWTEGGDVAGAPYAAALARGAMIGPSAHFEPGGGFIERGYGVESGGSDRLVGLWGGNPKNRYLGVRFLINGEAHYGWVRLTVTTQPAQDWSATITAYAYETVANKPILAGTAEKPTAEVQVSTDVETRRGPSLGMLASGAEALSVWKREGNLSTE